MNIKQFQLIEASSRDTINVKRIYIDMAGDLMGGILLSQIIYWHLPDREGNSRLKIERDGYLWLAKSREDWWEEVRINARQIDRVLPALEATGMIITSIYRFKGNPTTHIRIVWDTFLSHYENCLQTPPSNPYRNKNKKMGLPVEVHIDDDLPSQGSVRTFSPIGENGIDDNINISPFGENVSPNGEMEVTKRLPGDHQMVRTKSPNGELDITESGDHITEITTKITSEITTTTSGKPKLIMPADSDVVVPENHFSQSPHSSRLNRKKIMPPKQSVQLTQIGDILPDASKSIALAKDGDVKVKADVVAALIAAGIDESQVYRLALGSTEDEILGQIDAWRNGAFGQGVGALVRAIQRHWKADGVAKAKANQEARQRREINYRHAFRDQQEREAHLREAWIEKWRNLPIEERTEIECQARSRLSNNHLVQEINDVNGQQDIRQAILNGAIANIMATRSQTTG